MPRQSENTFTISGDLIIISHPDWNFIATAEILDIAVKPEFQGKGIGSRLIDYVFSQFSVNKITAETDDDAIEFYIKYGFSVIDTKQYHDTKRYVWEYKKF